MIYFFERILSLNMLLSLIMVSCANNFITIRRDYPGSDGESCPEDYELIEIHDEEKLEDIKNFLDKLNSSQHKGLLIGHYIKDKKWFDIRTDYENKFIHLKLSEKIPNSKEKNCIYLNYDQKARATTFHPISCINETVTILCEKAFFRPNWWIVFFVALIISPMVLLTSRFIFLPMASQTN